MEPIQSSHAFRFLCYRKLAVALALTLVAGVALAVPVRNLRQQSLDRALFEVHDDDVARIAELLEQGANINAVCYSPALHPSWMENVKRRFGYGRYSCTFGQDEIDGGTSLHYAIQFETISITNYLIDRKADVNRTSTSGFTPLMLAVMHGNEDLCRRLIEHGADINSRTLSGWTALTYATRLQNVGVRKLLVAHGARK